MFGPFYAMDTAFYHGHGRYTCKARAEILKDLGYAGTNATLWSDDAWNELPTLVRELDARGLALSGLYVSLDIHKGQIDPRLEGAMRLVANRGTLVEVAMGSSSEHDKPSSPRGDARAAELLNRVADLASSHGLRTSLYPHVNSWLERVEDAVRLGMRINRPDLGLTFNLFHWLYADGEQLPARLELALPRLWNVTINGSTKRGPRDCTIEPLGSGTFDTFHFLGTLARMGYTSPISLQGFGVGGDVYANLRTSLQAYRDTVKRVAVHADWSRMA